MNFSYTAPVDTYVYRTIMGSIGHSPMPFWYSYGYRFSHIYSGILNSANNNWEAGQSWLSNYGSGAQGIFGPYGYAIGNLQLDQCFETRCNRAAGSEQNQADFGLAAINNYNSNAIFTGNEKATATMGYASVFLGDRYNPTMRYDAQPPNRDWTDDSNNPTHTLPGVTAEDRGLGVYGITLAGGAASGNGTLRPSCNGEPNRNYCPKAWTAYGFSYQLNEGITSLSLTPQDIVDRTGSPMTWTEKIDRTKPRVTSLSGSLYDDRVETHPEGMGLYRPLERLNVTATDNGSGIKSIRLLSDGQPISGVPASTPSCGADCPTTHTGTFDVSPATLGPGSHVITVEVNDQIASHTSTSTTINVFVPNDNPIRIDDDDDGEPTTLTDTDDNAACPADPDYPNNTTYCEPDETNPLTQELRTEPGVDDPGTSLLRMGTLPAGSPSTASPASAADALDPTQPCAMFNPINGAMTGSSSRYGLSDQNAYGGGADPRGEDTFQDSRATALQVKHLRLAPEYDLIPLAKTAKNGEEFCLRYQKVYFWIARAQSRGQDVLISFNQSRTKNGQTWSANTVNRYRSAVQQFLTEFPGVRFYTPFNEPNIKGNTLTENNPGTAGKMFAALNELCRTGGRSCSVGAGDFSDVLSADKQNGFTTDYLNTYYDFVGKRKPTFWAVHTYQTVFREKYGRLQRFLDWSPVKRTGAVWITEVGVYKHRRTGTTYTDSVGADKLRAFVNSSTYQDNLKRIKRFFYYEWHGDGPNSEDTGLVANNVIPGGTKREVYCVFFAKTRPGVTCP